MTLGMNLKAERMNRGLSRTAAAKVIGVPSHVLRYAERGGCPHLENAKVIADFYGVKVTDIWPAEPTRPKAAA